MVAAIFEIVGWVGCEQHFMEGKDAKEVLTYLNWEQDLRCLARMGWGEELTPEGSAAIDHLWAVIDKYDNGALTVEDIAALNVRLSIGSLECLGVAEGEEAVAQLRQQYEQMK